jgi:hypothetical protein
MEVKPSEEVAMSTVLRPKPTVHPSGAGHLRLRRGVVAVSAIVTLLYAILFFVVRGIEAADAPGTDSTYGAYLFLTIAYAVSTVAYAVRDRRGIWLAGAVLQVVVIGLFIVFGLGVFEYEVLVEATPIGLWAGVITGLQVVLLGALGYLATLKPAGRHA